MDLDRDTSSTDEYYETARQIFDYYVVDSSANLRVDCLMDKFAPFVNTNKAEYSELKTILDPDHVNPEVNVTMLAHALHKFSESQKCKIDLDESFNLKTGQAPQDSDSGISTDGFQLLEELQCELKEKAHLAHQLRSQLDFTDRQHEEVVSTLTAERDSLRAHLNILREENMTLTHVRRDYEEACDRLSASEHALQETRSDQELLRRKNKLLLEQVATLETDKLTLQELLSKSKEECHRMNEMYAARQAALLERREGLRADLAALSAAHRHQALLLRQLSEDKALLETELKDLLNRSNHTQPHFDRSIEVSYTEDQMLTALDSLNADSRFTQEHRLLDEESFLNALKEDQGRSTNMSLFDEIRFSLNVSRTSLLQCEQSHLDTLPITVSTQTYDDRTSTKTQTDDVELYANNNNAHSSVQCLDCQSDYTAKLERDLKTSRQTLNDMQLELDRYEHNLDTLQNLVHEGDERNDVLRSVVDGLKTKIARLEVACAEQRDIIEGVTCDVFDPCDVICQTECDSATQCIQAEFPCVECEKRRAVVPHRSLRKFFWDAVKCLFQVFAVVCFVGAVCALYGVSRRSGARCAHTAVPWRWLDAQDLMDLLLRIEYIADVPM